MTQLSLWFANALRPELQATKFQHPALEKSRYATRGKGFSSLKNDCTFQWTPAVQALATLLLRTAAMQGDLSEESISLETIGQIAGEAASPASSLDYAISKQTRWLADMFGTLKCGTPMIKRLFKRQNPERKRVGPVIIWVNQKLLLRDEIRVYLDDRPISDARSIAHMALLIEQESEANRLNRVPSPATNCRFTSTSERAPGPFLPIAKPDDNNNIFVSKTFLKTVKDKMRLAFRSEILSSLRHTEIFDRSQYERTIRKISRNKTFVKMAGTRTTLVSEIDSHLIGANRLGSSYDELHLRRLLTADRPIVVAIPPTFVGAIAVFLYLKHYQGYNLEIRYKFSHSVEIFQRLANNELTDLPDACVLTLPSAGMVLGRRGKVPYYSLMGFPKVGHKTIVPNNAIKSRTKPYSYGEYLLLSDPPATAAFVLEELIDQQLVDKRRLAIRHMEADEVTKALSSGDPDLRGIVCFPNCRFSELYNSCTVVTANDDAPYRKESFLFAHKSFSDARAKALDIAVRDAWLALVQNPAILDGVTNMMVKTDDYVNFLGRCAGLYQLPIAC